MKDALQLAPREKEIAELLLQGCENDEIGKELKIARRTVKAHFNRLFVKFGIKTGIKRVKLATLLYRRQLCLEEGSGTENEVQASASNVSSSSWPKVSKTGTSQAQSEPQNMSSKTTSEPSMTSSDSGTGSSSPSGTKPAGTKTCFTPEILESWERGILSLEDQSAISKDIN
ncbi:MAG: response regulator transcription factor [Terriglobales bacterium]